MDTKTVWIINNHTSKSIYVAINRNQQLSALDVAISFDEALLKTKFPNRLHSNIASLMALNITSPEPKILVEYCSNQNDSIKISKSEQADAGIIDIWDDETPSNLLN